MVERGSLPQFEERLGGPLPGRALEVFFNLSGEGLVWV